MIVSRRLPIAGLWLFLPSLAPGVCGCAAASKGAPAAEAALAETQGRQRMIARSADLRVAVAELDRAEEGALRFIEEAGGHVEESRRQEESVWILARVPEPRLDGTLDRLAELGSVRARSVSAEDVTERYLDLETRLRNARALRDRLRQLLERATAVDEVLKIERELARVQSEVESMERRIKGIESRVALSPLSVTLERKRILGPLGWIGWGIWWAVEKLFVIR